MARRNSFEIIVEATEKAVNKAARRVALNVTAELRKDTPVDTGWAKANWIPQVGSPFTGVDGARVRGAISTSAQAAGTAQAAAFDIKKDTVIFITNNVPYIKKLNAGTSQQAPALFIESAVANAVNKSK